MKSTRDGTTHLDDQIKVPLVLIQRRRRITPNHLLAVNLRRDAHMLPDRQAQAVCRAREGKTVQGRIVREGVFGDEFKGAPFDWV